MKRLFLVVFVLPIISLSCVQPKSRSTDNKTNNAEKAPTLPSTESSETANFKKRLMPPEKLFDKKSPYFKGLPASFSLSAQSYDLSGYDSPVRDQGERSTCTAFGLLATLENMIFAQTTKKVDLSEEQLWSIYNQPNIDFAFWAATNLKIITEDAWPYGEKAPVKLGSGIVTLANFRPLDQNGVLHLISNLGFPVMFVTEVTEAWSSVKSDGIVDVNNASVVGGHAMELVGLKIDTTAPGGGWYKIKNSWSENWGDKGYAYLPFSYCEKFACQTWGFAYQLH